ncbi:hypothetical protein N7530_002415 [Penicillium desertorum]|uniref:Uncharacterized protein n=1 Tax=Penicillium desertorum TaxID=1303715 RepID=A0A9W9X4P7_9EURO|nr:hypothetical protein N7530_002415 [Penicillium desertorum]
MSSTPRFECADVDPSPLSQPLHFAFSGRTAPNRFLKGAMMWLYKCWGEGQIGLNLAGNVMIDPSYLETAGNLVIPQQAEFSGERFERFQVLALAGKAKAHGFSRSVRHRTIIGSFGRTEISVAECSTKETHKGSSCNLLQFPRLAQRARLGAETVLAKLWVRITRGQS